MPRKAREQSPTDFYHIMIRGINKEKIFEKKQHKEFLLEILKQSKENLDVEIGAYCIMNNHFHLIAKGDLSEVSQLLKKINIRFAMLYNKNLERVGHVFQDRFRSESIYNDNHLIQAISYIHNNPVKAGLTTKITDYKWSSYSEYFTKADSIISTDLKLLILDIVGGQKALEKFHANNQAVLFIDTEEDVEKLKQDIFDRVIKDYCEENGIIDASKIKNDSERMEDLVIKLLEQEVFPHREIARLLEINRNLVHSINNKK
ncbi:MAG: transposase [Gudongella sp.]|nr:transposase [Gudongella sp.]